MKSWREYHFLRLLPVVGIIACGAGCRPPGAQTPAKDDGKAMVHAEPSPRRNVERDKLIGSTVEVIELRDGTSFRNARVKAVSALGIEIMHESGFASVKFPDLSAEDQERFHYDAEEYAAALEEVVSRQSGGRAEGDSAAPTPTQPPPKTLLQSLEERWNATKGAAAKEAAAKEAAAKEAAAKEAAAKEAAATKEAARQAQKGIVFGVSKHRVGGVSYLRAVIGGPKGGRVTISKIPMRYESAIVIGEMFPLPLAETPSGGYQLAPQKGL